MDVAQNIAERERTEKLLRGRNKVLEQIATGVSLDKVLATLVETAENVNPEMIGSVLLLDKEKNRLRLGAAPNLPDFYNDAVDGLEIGEGVGSCGTAAYLGERVIVTDVMNHPYWADYGEIANKADIGACWSEPIVSATGEVLGTFAMYYREPREPDPRDLVDMETAAHLAGIAISHNRAQEELRMLNRTLETRVDERTRQLKDTADELARSNRDLEEFAAVLSHDLSAPIRAVAIYCELLQRCNHSQFDDEADQFIQAAIDGANRMQKLITDLLTFARVTRRLKEHKPVECEAVFRDVLANLRAEIDETDATVTHDPLPTVTADATQLMQLFQNLIGNGIKYCRDRPPSIHVGVREENGEWLFSVQDNGIGINPKQADWIFQIFHRLHSDEAEYSGTGIGLAVCKRIVEHHGGRIWVESDPGKGSTFHITLRKANAPQY